MPGTYNLQLKANIFGEEYIEKTEIITVTFLQTDLEVLIKGGNRMNGY